MFKRLLELLKLKQQRQPILQQCSVSRRSYSEDELAEIVDYCFQHIDADLLNSKQQFHRKVSIKHHLRTYVQQNGGISQTIAKPVVIDSPNELEPVLALINYVGELGFSQWYEVVCYYEKWCSYSGSKTFEDGEQVVKWKYVKDCL